MEELGYIDTGLCESFLYDGLEKNYGVENVDILNKVDDSGCNGLFAELGFSEGEGQTLSFQRNKSKEGELTKQLKTRCLLARLQFSRRPPPQLHSPQKTDPPRPFENLIALWLPPAKLQSSLSLSFYEDNYRDYHCAS